MLVHLTGSITCQSTELTEQDLWKVRGLGGCGSQQHNFQK